MQTEYPKSQLALDILHDSGIGFERDAVLSQFARWHRQCSTWNLAAKLMSKRDISEHFDDHLADSLSLVPILKLITGAGDTHHDIGSGAGFPGFATALLATNRRTVLWERDSRKSAFLANLVSDSGVQNVRVEGRNFEGREHRGRAGVYTARAVERPQGLPKILSASLLSGGMLVSQRSWAPAEWPDPLVIHPIVDEFDSSGLRRSKVSIIALGEILSRFHVEPS